MVDGLTTRTWGCRAGSQVGLQAGLQGSRCCRVRHWVDGVMEVEAEAEASQWRRCTHCLLLTAHCLLLTAQHWALSTHHAPRSTHHSALSTHHSPLTTHYLLLTTHYSLLTTHYSLLTTHDLLLTTYYYCYSFEVTAALKCYALQPEAKKVRSSTRKLLPLPTILLAVLVLAVLALVLLAAAVSGWVARARRSVSFSVLSSLSILFFLFY